MTLKFNSLPRKTLSAPITASATSFTLSDILDWNDEALTAASFGTEAYGVFHDAKNTKVEFFAFDPSTIADSAIDFTYRGLALNGENLSTEVSANKREWPTGTYVELGTHAPQMFQWLKEYIDGIAIAGSPLSTTSVEGIGRVSTAPVDANHPIFVGDNDPRVPTTSGAAFVSATTGMISLYAGSSAPTGFLLCDGSAVSRSTYSALFAIISTTFGVGDGSTTFNVPDLRGSVPIGAGTRVRTMTFDGASAVDPSTDTITVTSNDWLHTGQAVALTGSSLPTGLSATTYYVIRTSATAIKLATSVANANEGTAVDITADGSGTCTLTQTLTARTLGVTGGEETHALTDAEMPSHTHPAIENFIDTSGTSVSSGTGSSSWSNQPNTGSAGSDTPANNMPPYTVVNYIIKT